MLKDIGILKDKKKGSAPSEGGRPFFLWIARRSISLC